MNEWLQTIFSGLIAAAIMAVLNHFLTARHEKRSRLFERRLELYTQLVELILENEEAMARRDGAGAVAPVETQKRRISMLYRLTLVGHDSVKSAYQRYKKLVFQETEMPRDLRPIDPDDVVKARDGLIAVMRSDLESLGM